jgi:hypothetical protein
MKSEAWVPFVSTEDAVELDAETVAAIQLGIDDIDAGRFVTLEEIWLNFFAFGTPRGDFSLSDKEAAASACACRRHLNQRAATATACEVTTVFRTFVPLRQFTCGINSD